MGTDFLVDAKNVGAEGKTLSDLLNPKIHSITETGIFTIENYMYGHMAKIDSSVVTEIELSIYKGIDSDELNWIWVHNDTALVQKVVRNGQEFWLEAGQKVKFFIRGTTLVWGSAGWELIFNDEANTSPVYETDGNINQINTGDFIKFAGHDTGASANYWSGTFIIGDSTKRVISATFNPNNWYLNWAGELTTPYFEFVPTNVDLHQLWRWHNGE